MTWSAHRAINRRYVDERSNPRPSTARSASRSTVAGPTASAERSWRRHKPRTDAEVLREMKRRLSVLAGAILLVAMFQPGGFAPATNASPGLTRLQQRLMSGTASIELHGANTASAASLHGFSPRGVGNCTQTIASNVKVNQNCQNVADASLQGRSQAQNETAIAANPADPSQLVAGFNDYRRGDGTCGAAYSTNGGQTWNDTTVPNGFVDGSAYGGVAREYFQAGGDPSVAWDSKGNAYYDCQMFQRGLSATNNNDYSSGIFVYRSTGNGGASWDFTAAPVAQDYDTTGSSLLDKPYMTVDNHVGSPFADRIYVTWTLFAPDGSGIIYEAHSNDYGRSFSAPVLVSASSPLCTVTYGVPTSTSTCNENQFSDPFTGPDGSLHVVYANYNNSVSGSTDNHNQVLMVTSTDGGETFSAPVLVADYYDLPDCATYQGGQDFGRACVPEKGSGQNSVFRATNLPTGAVNPTDASQVVVTFGSYINADSNESNGCSPAGLSSTTGANLFVGVKTAGACSNKILLSVSSDGGATFTGTTIDPRQLPLVTPDRGQATTDQWWQWTDFSPKGTLAVSYYDRQYGDDETSGNMDISLSSSKDLASFKVSRVTSSSMPLPTQFTDAQGNSLFFGDYTGLTATGGAHPIWMDTRNPEVFTCPGGGAPQLCAATQPNGLLANDQDIFTSGVGLP